MSTRTVLPPEERKKELLAWLQAVYDVSNPEYIEKNGLEGQPSLSELYKKVIGRPCGGPYHKAIMDLGVIRKLEKKRYKRKFEWSRNRATPNPWMATALYNRCNSRCSQYWNETGKERTEKKEKRNQELKMEATKDMQREYFNEVQEDRVLIACKKANKEPKEIPNKENNLNLYGAYKDILEGVKRLEEKVGSLYYRNTPDHIRASVYDAMPGAILSVRTESIQGIRVLMPGMRGVVVQATDNMTS